MKSKRLAVILTMVGLLMGPALFAAKVPVRGKDEHSVEKLWKWNFQEAIEEAQKTGKDLFVDFSGSDWCIWCQRLSGEVLHKPAFLKEASKHFVLVELDYPRGRQEPAVRMQNARLKKKYSIAGYPTVYLMDSSGKPYARTGYRRGGPVPYLKSLQELRAIKEKRDKALVKASSLVGTKRAEALDGALEMLQKAGVGSYYLDEMREVVKLDGKGKGVLAKKYARILDMEEIAAIEGKGDFPQALRLIAAFRKRHAPKTEELQGLLVKVGMLHYRMKDFDGAIAAFEEGKAASPKTPMAKQLSVYIQKLQQMKENTH